MFNNTGGGWYVGFDANGLFLEEGFRVMRLKGYLLRYYQRENLDLILLIAYCIFEKL